MASRQVVYAALLVLTVASLASATRQLQQYGGSRTYAERREEDLSKRCPGYGNVGECVSVCKFIDDKVVNGFDETITFTVDLMDLNITSGDTVYTVCDPISGDISDFSSGDILVNIQDVPKWKLEKYAKMQEKNTTCEAYPETGACADLCDYIVGDDYNRDLNWVTAFHVLLKDYNLVSSDSDYTKCLPDSGLIIDFNNNKRLGHVKELEKTNHDVGL